jgi:hypothetical protein
MGDERSEGWTSTRNFYIWCARVRTIIGSRPDGWSRIGNFLLWWTWVRTTAVRRPNGDIWIAILALRRRASRRDTTSFGRLIDISFIGTWKESETVRVLRGVRTCCWNVECPDGETRRADGWCFDCLESERYGTSSERMEQWQMDVRTGWLDRLDGWQGTDFWIVEPLWSIITHKWFCPKHRMRPKY